MTQEMKSYILNHEEDTIQLIRDLCAIPAPLHGERKRAEFCIEWFKKHGGKDSFIDEADNAICPVNVTNDNKLVVIMAHTDTVFPDTAAYPISEDEEKIYCPGSGDDTANLAVVMMSAAYFMEKSLKPRCGILFVANSGEEGLGNLKGCRQLVKNYGSRIIEMISCDATGLLSTTCMATGSHRYRVTVQTEGGHSFGNFGKPNAIHILASLIHDLYNVEVPKIGDSYTTYNVGTIEGGTSINVIAQRAEMLYEYRSDHVDCMKMMQKIFEEIINSYQKKGYQISIELVGDRPCGNLEGLAAMEDLKMRVLNATRLTVGEDCFFCAASTDANIPLSLGIPAVTIGVVVGKKCHTREEWIEKSSLKLGMKKLMLLLNDYYE